MPVSKERYKQAKQKQRLDEYKFTDSCANCGKGLWHRDSEYSRHYFNEAYCAEHAPKQNRWDKPFMLGQWKKK